MVFVLAALSLILAGAAIWLARRAGEAGRALEELARLRRESAREKQRTARLKEALERERRNSASLKAELAAGRRESDEAEEDRQALLDELDRARRACASQAKETEAQRTRAAAAERELLLCRKSSSDALRRTQGALQEAQMRLDLLEAEQCTIPLGQARAAKGEKKPDRRARKKPIAPALGEQLSMEDFLEANG